MQRCWMLIAVILAAAAISVQAIARVQQRMLCWQSDVEFPVPCDHDD
jgi:hypothetical protein